MESLTELYRIGYGPSSSHTIGPGRAAALFLQRHPEATGFKAVLYGSLAKTGGGHDTDGVIRKTFAPLHTEIVHDSETTLLPHPNTMDLFSYSRGQQTDCMRVLSVGGGKIVVVGDDSVDSPDVYSQKNFDSIRLYCRRRGLRLWQYVEQCEGVEIWSYLSEVWTAMKESIEQGLRSGGTLPGGLKVRRRAKLLFEQKHMDETAETRQNRIVCSYAFAAAEQNAAGAPIVTAPTCGACGVLPAPLLYLEQQRGFCESDILHALAAGGVIGNVIKTNASISGAECGCQAEIGSACCMAAAALGELYGMDIDQIECAAEVALEHHLGLTCDPVAGLVQIPCIERNAVAAMRAFNAVSLANFLTATRKVSFDTVVKTMYETGKDLFSKYRETSEGGLAKYYIKPKRD